MNPTPRPDPSGRRFPPLAGIGLRGAHHRTLLERLPAIGWLEVHSENYFGVGGRPLHDLERARTHYPLSLHGVGLSLGSADPLSLPHLKRLKALVWRFEPLFVSEHLAWSSIGGRYLNDLLPLPYTDEVLRHLVERVGCVQDFLGRRILIENPSSYLEFTHSQIPEWEFVAALAESADCLLLLDINNVYVSCRNHGWDPYDYLAAIPARRVEEYHLAGFTRKALDQGEILIDTHNRPVAREVWGLYRAAVARLGARPTLIEWDTDLPEIEVLLGEAAKADRILESHHARAA